MSLVCRTVISTKQASDIVVSNAVLVLKALIQNQLLIGPSAPTSSQSPFTIISLLARRVDDIRHPQARACVLWLVGQYSAAPEISTIIEGVADWAPDVLRKISKSFNAEVPATPSSHLLSVLIDISTRHRSSGFKLSLSLPNFFCYVQRTRDWVYSVATYCLLVDMT